MSAKTSRREKARADAEEMRMVKLSSFACSKTNELVILRNTIIWDS